MNRPDGDEVESGEFSGKRTPLWHDETYREDDLEDACDENDGDFSWNKLGKDNEESFWCDKVNDSRSDEYENEQSELNNIHKEVPSVPWCLEFGEE